jgi:XTP/dITP diphosphohydrolase
MRLLVATTNANKVHEIRHLLSGLPVEVTTLAQWPDVAPPPETGRTFEENARAKARYSAGATGELTVAEDSGLEIDALDGAPGVESARFGGAHSTYPEKFATLYDMLDASGSRDSTARFVCALAVADGDAIVFEARGTVEGRIAPVPRGTHGFGYDPIFFFPPEGCTLAEVSDEVKRAVSHRGEAFRRFRSWLDSRL